MESPGQALFTASGFSKDPSPAKLTLCSQRGWRLLLSSPPGQRPGHCSGYSFRRRQSHQPAPDPPVLRAKSAGPTKGAVKTRRSCLLAGEVLEPLPGAPEPILWLSGELRRMKGALSAGRGLGSGVQGWRQKAPSRGSQRENDGYRWQGQWGSPPAGTQQDQ